MKTFFAALLMLGTIGNAHAATRQLDCPTEDFKLSLETQAISQELAAGLVVTKYADHPLDLFEIVDRSIQGPSGTKVYIAPGLGDGDTNFFYFAIPQDIASLSVSAQFKAQVIQSNDQMANPKNPKGISRKNIICSVIE